MVTSEARAPARRTAPQEDAPARAAALAEVARAKRARATTILDLRGLSSVADFFVICHGESQRQVKAIADAVLEESERPYLVEGYEGRRWILVDFVDVVVHIFDAEAREFYAIERLWGDAPTQVFDDGE